MWSFQEDNRLTDLVQKCTDAAGRPRWKEIAANLGSRTAQECRCRWRRLREGEEHMRLGKSKNRCSRCGMLRRGHSCVFNQRVRRDDVEKLVNAHVVNALRSLKDPESIEKRDQLEAFLISQEVVVFV